MKVVHVITGLGDGGAEHALFKIVNTILQINTMLFHPKVQANIFLY